MARIRTIKPEFPQSESMGRVSRDARLLFVELWTLCDDSGRARGNSRMLASLLFPYDDDASGLIDGWLNELEREGCVRRYDVDGDAYLLVEKWQQHQKIDKPSPSKFPGPREHSRGLAEPSRKIVQDQGPRTKEGTKDQGEGSGSNEPPPPTIGSSKFGSDEAAAVVEYWNSTLAEPRGLTQVSRLTPARRKKIAARIAECGGFVKFVEAIDAIDKQPFLLGKNDRGWKVDFDWILNPANLVKIEEGKYRDSR